MPSSNAAAFIETVRANPLVVKDAPEPPTPGATEIVVRNRATAINPLDCIIQQSGMIVPENAYPYILGSDLAGVVVSVGESVTKVKPGDRVLACTPAGAFQLMPTVDQSLVAILPDHVTFAQGSVLPLALCTAAVMLFQQDTLALDHPSVEAKSNGKVVVAWGGASALGSCGIQMLKAAGYDVAAVAGASNQQYCKDLGADFTFDHRAPNVLEEIVNSLKGKPFAGVFCPIMNPEPIATCIQIADRLGDGPKNKVVASSFVPDMPYQGAIPEGVKVTYCWGDSLKHNEVGPAVWDKWLSAALANGSMKCKPEAEVVGTGLEHIQEAMNRQAKGVSAKKLVVELA